MQPEIELFGLTIYTFGLMVGVAFIVAGWVVSRRLAELGRSTDWSFELVFCALVGGVLGAKLWWLAEEWQSASDDPLAALTSPVGLVWYGGLVGGVAAVALWTRRRRLDPRMVADLAAPALAPLGFLSFHALLWSVTGEPLTWFRVQRELWQERVSPLALLDDLDVFSRAPFENTNTTAVVAGTVVTLVGLVLMVRARLPGVLVVYTAVVVLLAASSETLGLRPRFVLTAFPLFLAFALHLRGAVFAGVLGLSATLLGAFTMISLSTILFTP